MIQTFVRPFSVFASALVFVTLSGAAVVNRDPSRFDRAVIPDPSAGIGVIAESPESLPDFEVERAGWESFRATHGRGWKAWIDRRSGAPLLAEGEGIPWFDPDGPVPSVDALAERALGFLKDNGLLLRVGDRQLSLNREASAAVDKDRFIIVFDRVVDGIPVEKNRVALHVVRGRLVSFGADRWGAIDQAPRTRYGAPTAREVLYAHMGILLSDVVADAEEPRLVLSPERPADAANRYRGPVGRGNAYRPVWRFALRVSGEVGTWVGKVDAITGQMVALYDDDKYANVYGGVFPRSNDLVCPDGCEQPGFPMPYSTVTINGVNQTTGDTGQYGCSPVGGNASTALNGPYFRISDSCGALSETTVCDEDIDLGVSPNRNNCAVQPGESAGNTGPSRTAFYQTNRIKEKMRYWLPANNFANQQTTINTNVNSTCNATWGGSLNMYRAGNGCRNTGELAGVVNHELGHGIDQNDGGGYDNPSEAYGDVVAIIQEHRSCVGRGFFESGVCSGYGDTCLTCSGIRDMNYAARTANTPATPANFTGPRCGGGSGPCGKEVHCEAYPPGEAVYDLATRDLPAAGFDAATSWQIVERIFYKSRQGSTGDVFNCSLPNSDGCNVNGWYNTMRVADDDDGNLANGTPHAAAIYAAFNRHAIACGNPGDASNQSSSGCPALAKPAASVVAGSNAATLSWGTVSGAANYLILRNEVDCDFSSNVVATVPTGTTSYADLDLPNDLPFHYRVQAQGSNVACHSPVSECVSVTAQPFAGTIKFDRLTYACQGGTINMTVRDANVGAGTVIATISSMTESTPETVVLTQTAPGSAKFVGSIGTTTAAGVPGDGLLSTQTLDLITARYIDADDGQGGVNLTREVSATSDCTVPLISAINTTGVTDVAATISWQTDEASDSRVHWGQVLPPGSLSQNAALVNQHTIPLTGLQSCTVYYFSVESQDVSGNIALDDRTGSYYAFETLGNLGSGLQPCHAGTVTLGRTVLSCSDSLPVQLVDIDMNLSSTIADTVTVRVSSSSEPGGEALVLTETGVNTSRFTGNVATSSAPPVAGNGVLETAHGELLTATYDDANDGTGSPAVAFDTSITDCTAPVATSVSVTDVGDESVIVRWNTSEPASGRVDWGPTPALGNVVSDPALTTNHALTLAPINECGRFYFRVTTTDTYGYARVLDAAGVPFEGNAFIIPSLWREEFEATAGWTLEGEWQIAAPQAKGSAQPDPASAFTGTKVLGHDLTGLGANQGDYEPTTTQSAISPVINASSLADGQLRFRRWLNVGAGGVSYIDVKSGPTWNNVWSSNSVGGQSETAWTSQSVSIAPYANGNAALQIRFRQYGGFSAAGHRSGWNVDRLMVHDGAGPDFVACGGCSGAPTFAGAQAAADVSGCADTGVSVSWAGSPAWGTGGPGTYAVYRDVNPTFTPQASNRIAAGLAGIVYTDLAAPNDVDLYYVVRAENAETCSTGPNNGGVTDANLVRVHARDATTQPSPGDIGGTLAAVPVNGAHVRISWAAIPTAAAYRVYRAQTPTGPFGPIAQTGATIYDDPDAMGDSASFYYRVKAVDACGNEGP